MSPSYLLLRHSGPVPSSTTFAAPLPGNSLRRAKVQLVSLTVLICLISSSPFSPTTALSRFLFSRPPRTPSKKSSCRAAIDRLGTWKDFSTSHLNHTKLLQTSTPELLSFPLRFPFLRTLGLTPPDIYAIEAAIRQGLLRLPLPQALDFIHSQILAIMCINAPRRPRGTQNIHSLDPLSAYRLLFGLP